MPFVNCAIGTLSPYTPNTDMPWNRCRASHLFRRTQFGTHIENIDEALSMDPSAVIKSIIQQAKDLPLTQEPEWAYWQRSDYPLVEDEFIQEILLQRQGWITQWVKDMKINGLRDRMSFFWHSHLVTGLEAYGYSSWMYQYHMLLQKYALGNYREFVREMGLTPAMLIYLDGYLNTRFDPNENFGRELLELFTLGVDNGYTQTDIVEAARSLTGWNDVDYTNLGGPIGFNEAFWDPGEKTFLGRTGNWGYHDIIDILFEERATEISEYICGKIYRHFVNPREDEQIIMDMAVIMRENDFEMEPVLEALFCSEHFFDEANYSTVIPGHIEYFLTFLNEFNLEFSDNLMYALGISASEYDQVIFNPVNVAGWDGNRTWINSGSLSYRTENIANLIILKLTDEGASDEADLTKLEFLRDWLIQIIGESDTDPLSITGKVIEFIFPKGFQFDYEYEEAAKVFIGDIPETYFNGGGWSVDWEYVPIQVFYLINHLAYTPEYQLK